VRPPKCNDRFEDLLGFAVLSDTDMEEDHHRVIFR
jgi:hypothetical protein